MDKKKLFGTIFFIFIFIFYFIWGKKINLTLGSVLAIPVGFLGLFAVPTQKLGNLWWKILFRKYLFLLLIIVGVADLPISSNLKLTVIFFILALGMLVSSRRGLSEL
ncbi:hypothetical protein SAMN04487897_1627 [Paenibacillus sp. yr247]|nr:hypothetical protein SAMN04487897_1627 [Paenibacillus sp. yr247]